MSQLDVVTLGRGHVREAAEIFLRSFREIRDRIPDLPDRYLKAGAVQEKLDGLLTTFPGVAAVSNGALVGYLIGLPVPSLLGTNRGVYSPEWANAASGPDRSATYRAMYSALSRSWVEAGCFTHAVTLLAGDDTAFGSWLRGGFAPMVTDAVRSLDPVPASPSAAVSMRRATIDDLEAVRGLEVLLQRHLASAPIFMPLLESESTEAWKSRLTNPREPVWLAFSDGQPVAYIKGKCAEGGMSDVVLDEHTLALDGAFTREEHRGRGVARALLNEALSWARSSGFLRCAVDFEVFNDLARGFWLEHFRPVCHSLIRFVDSRIAWAGENRDCAGIW